MWPSEIQVKKLSLITYRAAGSSGQPASSSRDPDDLVSLKNSKPRLPSEKSNRKRTASFEQESNRKRTASFEQKSDTVWDGISEEREKAFQEVMADFGKKYTELDKMVRLLKDVVLNQDPDKAYLDKFYVIVHDMTIENMEIVERYKERYGLLRVLGEFADKVVTTLFRHGDRNALLDEFAEELGMENFSILEENPKHCNYPELIGLITTRQKHELGDAQDVATRTR
jgi:hypothetical protein